MKVKETGIPGLLILEPIVYGDERGFFMESYNKRVFRECTGLDVDFVQDNQSRSSKNVLRGLHYQIKQPQGKLVRVTSGRVYDVAVDLRKSSPAFGKWFGVELSEYNHRQFWIPAGFGHGFLVLSEKADFLYKASDYYELEFERCIRWDDPAIGIDWPLVGDPLVSNKDQKGISFRDAEVFL